MITAAKIRKILITLVFFTRFNAIKGRLSTNNPPLLHDKRHFSVSFLHQTTTEARQQHHKNQLYDSFHFFVYLKV